MDDCDITFSQALLRWRWLFLPRPKVSGAIQCPLTCFPLLISGFAVVEQLCLKVLAPEFQTDPTVLGLAYSHDNRRCQYTGGILGYMYAVAREGFTSGYEQFTVHVIETGWQLSIGVAVANATNQPNPLSLCNDAPTVNAHQWWNLKLLHSIVKVLQKISRTKLRSWNHRENIKFKFQI